MKQLELPTLEYPIKTGENVMADLLPIRHVVRGINKKGMYGAEGDLPADVVETTLAKYYADGYRLDKVYMIDNKPDFINLLYVFVLSE